jgi:alanine racemase
MEYYRPTRAEINLDNLLYNYYAFRERVGKNVAIMGVVKANAYGHGAAECAKELVQAGSEYLGVASADEAIQIRNANIATPILILGFSPPEKLNDLIKYNLTYTVYNLEFVKELSRAGERSGKTQKVHIKCDTGMGRLGFRGIKETLEAAKLICSLPFIELEGIFSHFSESDAKDKTYTNFQFKNFRDVLDSLWQEGVRIRYRHIANSAAAIDLPYTFLDMVRPGISMYGMYPSEYVQKEFVKIKTVMNLKTEIAQLKTLSKGEYLGYKRTFQAGHNMLVATLPVGYSDGYQRKLSNNNHVLVHGKEANVIGLICMDQCMIDVSDIENIQLRDEVLLFGEELPPKILADNAGTIHHEITSCVGPRIPRIYIKNGKVISMENVLTSDNCQTGLITGNKAFISNK